MGVSLGWCAWDLPALLILAAIAAVFIVRHRGMRKKERELSEELARRSADELIDSEQ